MPVIDYPSNRLLSRAEIRRRDRRWTALTWAHVLFLFLEARRPEWRHYMDSAGGIHSEEAAT